MGSRTSDSGASAREVTARLATLDPAALRTASVTVNVPAAAKAWLGCCAALVPPSPKSHDHDVGLPVELSENWTAWFTSGDAGDNVNAAEGMDAAGGVEESDGVDEPPHAAKTTAATTKAGAIAALRLGTNPRCERHPGLKWTV
jgi:hypothetical protein